MNRPPETIDCVECGGQANLMSFLPEDEPPDEGYAVAYQCSDCGERYDLVWQEEEDPAD